MRKEDLVKFLLIYNNDFSSKYVNSLKKMKKEEIEKEFQKIDLEKLKEIFSKKEMRIYSDLVFLGHTDKKMILKKEFSLIEKYSWDDKYHLHRELKEFLKKIVPLPKGYNIEYIECEAIECNYYIKEYLEVIKNLDIKIGSTNRVKKSDIKRIREIFNTKLNDTELSWIIFAGVKYFEKHKRFKLKKFYDFIFYNMGVKNEFALFRMIFFSIDNLRFKEYFDSLFEDLREFFKHLNKCVTMENLQKYVVYRKIGLYFSPYEIESLDFKAEYLKIEPLKVVYINGIGRVKNEYVFYEEFMLQFFKGFSDFLSAVGLLELDIKENDTIIDVFYGNIYAAKLSNIGLWYFGYTNDLILKTPKKSEIKAFNKILAITFDENDLVLKSKVEKYFTKKGSFYILDDEKILKGITSKDDLISRIKDVESLKLPKNFKIHLNSLLKKFKEIKKVNYVVLEVDKETLKILEKIKNLFLLAEDNKILLKDYQKFKKEAQKLGVFVKEIGID